MGPGCSYTLRKNFFCGADTGTGEKKIIQVNDRFVHTSKDVLARAQTTLPTVVRDLVAEYLCECEWYQYDPRKSLMCTCEAQIRTQLRSSFPDVSRSFEEYHVLQACTGQCSDVLSLARLNWNKAAVQREVVRFVEGMSGRITAVSTLWAGSRFEAGVEELDDPRWITLLEEWTSNQTQEPDAKPGLAKLAWWWSQKHGHPEVLFNHTTYDDVSIIPGMIVSIYTCRIGPKSLWGVLKPIWRTSAKVWRANTMRMRYEVSAFAVRMEAHSN